VLVLFFLDEHEFLFDLFAHGAWNAAGPDFARTFPRALPQLFDRREPRFHDFGRIAVVEFAQVERAQRGDAQRFGEQFARVERLQIFDAAQVAFAVRKQRMARFGDRAVMTDRGHDIVQRAAATHVHVHVAAGDERQAVTFAECAQRGETRRIVGFAMQFDGDPGSAGEMEFQPDGLFVEVGCVVFAGDVPAADACAFFSCRCCPRARTFATQSASTPSPQRSTSSRTRWYSPFPLRRRPVVMSLQMSE
jgi:hypothetical protein